MKAVTAILALGLLCSVTEARLSWQHGSVLRGLLQLQPMTATAPMAAAPGAATAPAATTTAPMTATAPMATQPAVSEPAAVQPAVQPAATTAPVATAAAEPTEPPAPREFRPGVYVLDEPPPKPSPAPVAATAAAANATGPVAPTPGKNLMVVMTVMGQDAGEIYKNQGALKQQLAAAAGVRPGQIFFYNQTANSDARTGVTAMSLIMNVDCTDTAECARAGATLVNTTSQTRLTDGLAKGGVSLLPGTFQVYGVNSVGRYKGNETLYENKALLAPKTATSALDYNATMARFNSPLATAAGANATAAAGGPGMPLGNFSIPGFTIENATIPTVSAPGLNLTQGLGFGNLSLPGVLPGDVAPAEQPAEPAKPKSAAGVAAAGLAGLPLMVAAAAVLLL
uniref:Uncharacterized protein n=1 Tax=Tetradesmus obliquus TaxID=3088 RepID=A0A383VHN9_TETOB